MDFLMGVIVAVLWPSSLWLSYRLGKADHTWSSWWSRVRDAVMGVE